MTPASASTNDANRASLCWPPRPDIAAPPREQCRTYGFVPALSRRPCDSVRLGAFSDWVWEVKLLLVCPCPDCVAPAGHSLLFAVGAGPPHDGVRRARRLNLSTTLR